MNLLFAHGEVGLSESSPARIRVAPGADLPGMAALGQKLT